MVHPFEIVLERENSVLRLKVQGFWTLEEAVDYRESFIRAISSMGNCSWSVLADVRFFPIQLSAVQSIHAELMNLAVESGMTKCANIVGSTLTKLQIERLFSQACPHYMNIAWFKKEEEARKWLEDVTYEFSEKETDKLFQTI